MIVLEAAPGTPGSDPAAAPPRFVLLKDGQVFAGGTERIEAGRLEKGEASALEKRAEAVRKLPGISSSPVALGGDPSRTMRLRLPEERVDVVATGDPAQAPPALGPLASLLSDLLSFHHPSLRPYEPTSYAMTVREARLAGGCRTWPFAFSIAAGPGRAAFRHGRRGLGPLDGGGAGLRLRAGPPLRRDPAAAAPRRAAVGSGVAACDGGESVPPGPCGAHEPAYLPRWSVNMRPTPCRAAGLLLLLTSGAAAQDVPPTPALELPVGARVRLRTQAAPGDWMKGTLAGADSGTIALVPDGAPPLGSNQLRLPRESVTRLELVAGRKRQWLPGLAIGLAVGVGMGFAVDVDPERCEFDDNYFCSRGGAVAAMGGTSAALGAGIGALLHKDVWMPVGLDALGPPPARVTRAGCGLRVVPGGLALDVSVRF